MRANEILTDARRNPDQNPKTPINAIVKQKLAATSTEIFGLPNLFITLGSIEKVGIHTKQHLFHETTPTGIYAYNARFLYKKLGPDKNTYQALPFAGDNYFLNFFSAKGNIINLKTISEGEVTALYPSIKQVALRRGVDEATVNSLINDAPAKAKKNSGPGGVLWVTTKLIAKAISNITKSAYQPIWNKVWRAIGVDGVVDPGTGIIHSNEKNQAVFFHTGAITNLERVDNKYSPDVQADRVALGVRNKQLWYLNRKATDAEFLTALTHDESLIDKVDQSKLTEPVLTKLLSMSTSPVIGYKVLLRLQNPSEEVVKAAIAKSPQAINLVKNPSEELQLSVVSRLPHAIFRINSPSERVQLAAIAHSQEPILGQIRNPTPAAKAAHNAKWPTNAR